MAEPGLSQHHRRTTNFAATTRSHWEFHSYCRVLTHVIALRRVVRRASKLVRRTAQFSIEFSPQYEDAPDLFKAPGRDSESIDPRAIDATPF